MNGPDLTGQQVTAPLTPEQAWTRHRNNMRAAAQLAARLGAAFSVDHQDCSASQRAFILQALKALEDVAAVTRNAVQHAAQQEVQ